MHSLPADEDRGPALVRCCWGGCCGLHGLQQRLWVRVGALEDDGTVGGDGDCDGFLGGDGGDLRPLVM